MTRRRRRRPGVDAARRVKGRAGKTVTRLYSTRYAVPQTSFARWCAAGAPWGQTNLDPDIVLWIVRLMREREAAGINTITNLLKWIELHKPVFSWTTPLEWERVILSARAMWIAYCPLMQEYQQREAERG